MAVFPSEIKKQMITVFHLAAEPTTHLGKSRLIRELGGYTNPVCKQVNGEETRKISKSARRELQTNVLCREGTKTRTQTPSSTWAPTKARQHGRGGKETQNRGNTKQPTKGRDRRGREEDRYPISSLGRTGRDRTNQLRMGEKSKQ